MGLISSLFGAKKMPIHVDDATFTAEVTQSDIPVLLDVWSPGCAPCKQLEEVMLTLRQQYDGRVKICEMNSAAAPRAAMRLKIAATPTVVYFKGGREVERITGFRSSVYHQEAIAEVFGVPKKAPNT